MESGNNGWTSGALATGWVDQWHLSANRSHSSSHSWKFGGSGTGTDTTYANHAYGGLVSPPVTLRGQATLTYWQFMRGEISGAYPDSAYDLGVVDVSVDSGAWQQLTTVAPGYNKLVRCMAGGSRLYSGPFSCRQPGYSGAVDWSQVSINLDAYAGHSLRFRFRFGSDSLGTKEGWYVDDFSILGLPQAPVAPSPVINVVTDVTDAGLRLAWPPSGAPWYKVYSGGTATGPFPQLETTTADTVVILPIADDKRFYIVTSSSKP
jgi:bacillopeptidase F